MSTRSTHDSKLVRVATLKDGGRQYLLHSFFKSRALCWGECTLVKGTYTEHRGMFQIDESQITWRDEKKTPELAMALLKQAQVGHPAMAVTIKKGGAALVMLETESEQAQSEREKSTLVRLLQSAMR